MQVLAFDRYLKSFASLAWRLRKEAIALSTPLVPLPTASMHHREGKERRACKARSRSRSISPSPATLADSQVFGAHVWEELGPRLTDFQDKRLRLMDASGVEIMILSLNAPAVQAIPDVKRAIAVAREANDVLAAEIAKRPDRFAGFAALPMQDPDEAARELTRCVKELGFVGALVNGFSQAGEADSALYYDLPQYRPFWRTVARTRRAVLPASAQSAARRISAPTTGTTGCSARTGRSMPRPPCMRCA